MADATTITLPGRAGDLDGVTRAAVLLLSLDADAAEKVLGQLGEEMVEQVTAALARIEEVPPALAAEVVESFYGLQLAGSRPREGGLDYATTLVRGAFGERADAMVQNLRAKVRTPPFAFLAKAPTDNILTFLQDEHPQTIALVVSHVPHGKASEILAALAAEKQIEVVRRMAHMEQISPEVIHEVEVALAQRLSSMALPAAEGVGGVETVAEMLNLCDRATEKAILEGIEVEDPELVEKIRRLMFVFEDILLVDDKGIQAVLKEVDNDELCLSLKTASEELKEKVFSNMSARASELIKEEMQYLGPVRLSDVEAAQQRIVDIVRRLEDAGEIIVAGRGGEGDTIV